MRLLTYDAGDGPRAGLQLQEAGDVHDVEHIAASAGLAAAPGRGFRDLVDVLPGGPDLFARLADAASGRSDRGVHAAGGVRFLPPVPAPSKIICLGLNYHDHAEEMGAPLPTSPMFFAKFANSLIGDGDTIVPPRTAEKVDYEAELTAVIGTRCRGVGAGDALDHVAGVTLLNDVSARNLQLANPLWTGGKAIDTFAPCGPAIVTLDEIDDLQNLAVTACVNGTLLQNSSTAKMIFGVAETIAFLSQIMTLEPGDLIATGTPAGVGAGHRPPVFLHEGDVVEIAIDRVGTLTNLVGAPYGSTSG